MLGLLPCAGTPTALRTRRFDGDLELQELLRGVCWGIQSLTQSEGHCRKDAKTRVCRLVRQPYLKQSSLCHPFPPTHPHFFLVKSATLANSVWSGVSRRESVSQEVTSFDFKQVHFLVSIKKKNLHFFEVTSLPDLSLAFPGYGVFSAKMGTVLSTRESLSPIGI